MGMWLSIPRLCFALAPKRLHTIEAHVKRWHLTIQEPGGFERRHDVPEGITRLGCADDNDIVLSGELVSSYHARLHLAASGLVFEDLGNRNGVQLNGLQVAGRHELRSGDVVVVGETTLRVLAAETAIDSEPATAQGPLGAGEPLPRSVAGKVTVLGAELTALETHCLDWAPEQVLELLAAFHGRFRDIVSEFAGAFGGAVGASAFATFCAPSSGGGEALAAVRAAVRLKDEWDKLLSQEATRLPALVRLKVGLHTGRGLWGTVGSEPNVTAVALGEPATLARHVLAWAQPGQVLVTGKTLACLKARFDVAPLGEHLMEGGRFRAALFEVLQEDSEPPSASERRG